MSAPVESLSNLLEASRNILSQVTKTHLVVLGSVLLIYLILYQLYLHPYVFSPLRHVPGPPLGHPIFGQSPTIINSETGIPQREWVKQYGPVVRVVGPVGFERVMFMRPEALHKILVKDWLEYPRPGFLRNILGLVTGYGLLTVTGDEHKQMRKAMNPAFSIPNLTAQVDMYYDSIDSLVEIISKEIDSQPTPEEGKEILVYNWLSKATLDIICETAFGYRSDSLHNPHNELAEAYEDLVNLQSGPNIAKLIIAILIPGVPKLLLSDFAYKHRNLLVQYDFFNFLSHLSTLLSAMHRIKRISGEMLKEKMRESTVMESESDGGSGDLAIEEGDLELGGKKDIMSILVRARMREERMRRYTNVEKGDTVGIGGYRMSDEAMMDQVLTFLGAGHETTSSGLAWTLWLLANDQESQNKLREEVLPVFRPGSEKMMGRPDYKTLKDLKWLDCVVMESLRVMPPVPLTVRRSTKTDYIDGVLVPKGTLFWIPIRVVNTWKVTWGEDAEEFRPGRWLDLPKSQTYHSTFSMLSFIAGPHACIGKTMAIVEMKAVLGALIANFTFEPAYKGQKAKPAAAITMKPTDGMPLRVKKIVL